MTRIDKHSYFLLLAHAASLRGTCPRRQVGAVLVHNDLVVSTGYNGAAKLAYHCTDVGCLMFKANDRDEPHCIRTVHAELNAILHAKSEVDTLYCTDQPCRTCLLAAVNAGVSRVVYYWPYVDLARDAVLQQDTNLSQRIIIDQWSNEELDKVFKGTR